MINHNIIALGVWHLLQAYWPITCLLTLANQEYTAAVECNHFT